MTGLLTKRAWTDLRATLADNHIWRALALADIRSKYRNSTLGTLWITLSTGILVVSISLIYGQLFGQDLSAYLPYFATGMIVWTFMSSVLNEATQALITSGSWIKGSSLPVSFYVMRMLQRNFLILLHNFSIIALVWLYYRWPIELAAVSFILGLAIIYAFLAGAALVIAFLCVRYRDVPPMVSAATQFIFFASPIIWMPDQLKVGQFLLHLNPIAYMLAIVRDPILGKPVPLDTWAAAVAVTAASLGLAVLVYSRYRSRIAYWV